LQIKMGLQNIFLNTCAKYCSEKLMEILENYQKSTNMNLHLSRSPFLIVFRTVKNFIECIFSLYVIGKLF
jgi:hypothetical protein